MKVKELIEALSKIHPEAEINITTTATGRSEKDRWDWGADDHGGAIIEISGNKPDYIPVGEDTIDAYIDVQLGQSPILELTRLQYSEDYQRYIVRLARRGYLRGILLPFEGKV